MSEHPYKNLPDYRLWRRAHDVKAIDDIDPLISVPFRIGGSDSVVSAGSCFAQHIARHLGESGYNYLVTEEAHPLIPDDVARRHNYGVFTARYGNLYTPRQLLQLFKRAYGKFKPVENVWVTEDGRFLDPYRPTVEPRGFGSQRELELDRERHLAAVRDAFQRSKIFVFTFGLTEAFVNRRDGAVYPVCPGVAGGQFDPARHVFKNFTVEEVTGDFLAFIDLVRRKNPTLKFIVTVSPVPLVATAEDRSVIASTAYSKAVLRVACDEISKLRPNVAYFPSLEIITGNHARGKYFANDLRSVTESGVEHVMKIFMRHFAEPGSRPGAAELAGANAAALADDREFAEIESALETICDEELLDSGLSREGATGRRS